VYVYGHRRIVKVGHSHTVTLPPAWLEKVGVTAGDDVVLTGRGRDLIISPAGRVVDVNKNREEQDHDSTQRD